MKTIIRFIVGISILVGLFYWIGFIDIYTALISMNIKYIPLILLLHLLTLFIGSINIKVLSLPVSEINLSKINKYYLISTALGSFVPARVGDFSLVFLFKRENLGYGKGLVITILDKLITLAVLSFFSLIGFFYFFPLNYAFFFSSILLLLYLLIILSIKSEKSRYFVRKHLLRSHSKKLEGFHTTLLEYYINHKRVLLFNFVLTIFRWAMTVAFFYLLVYSLHVDTSYLLLLPIMAISTLAGLVPLSINGIGIREAVFVYFFNKININLSIVGAMSIVAISITYGVSILILLIFWNEIKFKKKIRGKL